MAVIVSQYLVFYALHVGKYTRCIASPYCINNTIILGKSDFTLKYIANMNRFLYYVRQINQVKRTKYDVNICIEHLSFSISRIINTSLSKIVNL